MKFIFALCCIALVTIGFCQPQQPITGGWKESDNLNLDDETYNKLFGFALQDLSNKDPDFAQNGWQVNNIRTVKTQIVAGMNYDFEVELINNRGQLKEMEWIIFYQPWTDTIYVRSAVNQPQDWENLNDPDMEWESLVDPDFLGA